MPDDAPIPPAREQLRRHIAAIDGRRPQNGHSERGFSVCPHPDCVAAQILPPMMANAEPVCKSELPAGAVGDLLAYGRQESQTALTTKNRDAYQFWQGWCAALERVPAPVSAQLEPHTDASRVWLMTLLAAVENEDWSAFDRLKIVADELRRCLNCAVCQALDQLRPIPLVPPDGAAQLVHEEKDDQARVDSQ